MAQVTGLDMIMANFDRYTARKEKQAEAAMTAVCAALEGWAKAEHTYTDRTGKLTSSIRAFVSFAKNKGATARLTATAPEAVFLELARSGEWAFLLPIIERHQDDIFRIIRTHLSGGGSLL